MNRFLIAGAGRQGCAVASFLLEQFEDTAVDFVDCSTDQLEQAVALQKDAARVAVHEITASSVGDDLRQVMSQAACVVSCVPYHLNLALAAAAVEVGTPFCDLGGNVGTVAAQIELDAACKSAGIAIAPDCGLAPGLLNILAEYWAGDWKYESVKLYCGGLPQNPTGVFKYALTFNVCGLLNEYLDDCEVSRGGKLQIVRGMSELEHLSDLGLPGEFEAFATSGGTSLGAKDYAAKGVDYIYKTIRYPGHCDVIRAMREMGCFGTYDAVLATGEGEQRFVPRDILAAIMEKNLPSDGKDLVVARAEVRGKRDGEPMVGRIDLIDYAVGRFTAMERTTGFPTAIVAATLAGLYEKHPVEPGARVPLQFMNPRLVIEELARGGVTGINVQESPAK
ncbi:MAG: hypothetical protein GXP29_07225 [Planctomycetes bacterium]|nr:hypothetical protein [Planctomycetota bacterium]